ncbi:hypothetical protein CAL14_05515 [Bordetella genomosp. 9]|nr:hypothetical protein CAL14_05515 [Bordetella genomosp. 9]
MSYGKGRGGRPWRRLRDQIMKRDGYMCQCENCKGVKLVAHEVDHIIPVAKGGTDHPDNLRAMNRDCHAEKTKREANQGYRPKVAIGTDGWPSAN